jgi:uncharacterized protein
MNGAYKILSLDGGGSWALIQVKALQDLYGENAGGHDVLRRFDLVAATSGGSIVAGMLATGVPLSKILAFFKDEAGRKKIFVRLRGIPIVPTIFHIGPKYSTPAKFEGLKSLLGEAGSRVMEDLPGYVSGRTAKPDFLITSFGYDRERVVYFRSDLKSRASSFLPAGSPQKHFTLAEAIHASSTPPVNYFKEPAEFSGGRYWDGGVSGNNNPALSAVVEAVSNGHSPNSIRVLSIGTGLVFLPTEGPAEAAELLVTRVKPGLITDIQKLATTILDDPPDAASFISHVMLGQRLPNDAKDFVTDTSLVRMNPLLQPVLNNGKWSVPWGSGAKELKEFTSLKTLGLDAIENDEIRLIEDFCDRWTHGSVVNQPIRARSDLSCEIGHGLYRSAKSHWQTLDT